MPKQNAYTIQDDIFLDTLQLIAEHFQQIPHALVGSGATQIYAAFAALKSTRGKSVKDFPGFALSLRKIGGLEVLFDDHAAELDAKFQQFTAQTGAAYSYQHFTKRFVSQQEQRRFNLNYCLAPEDLPEISAYYDDIVHTALTVDIPGPNRVLQLKIGCPEYLIVAGLLRAKPRDLLDMGLLLRAVDAEKYPFDAEEVRSILESVNKEERYDILAELMEAG
jgi:hypothetical protein